MPRLACLTLRADGPSMRSHAPMPLPASEPPAVATALASTSTHVLALDPQDIFVFVRQKYLATIPEWLKEDGIYTLPVNEETWTLPEYLRPEEE